MGTFNDRMKAARLRAGFKSQQAAADAIGCSRGTVGNWESQEASEGVSSEYLLPVAAAYRVHPDWVTGASTDDRYPWSPDRAKVRAYEVRAVEGDDDFDPTTELMVSEVDVLLSAGGGSVVPEFIETTFKMPFQAYWFDKFHAKAENVRIMKVHGTSMEPLLYDGDRVVIHLADKRIVDGRVYAVLLGEDAKVKRLFKLRDGSLRVVSDHQDKTIFPDEIVPASDMGSVFVLGRVIDKSGSGGL
jgi:phage repressor protein C with HTH and peptisase S24 domain